MDKRILIVDDDQGFGDLLKGVFEHAGYAVHLCLNAEAALDLMDREPVDLLVTDQRLPGRLNGTDLIRGFREKGLEIPVIVISGYLDNDAIRGLIRDGVEGVFIKPLNIFSLLKKASEVLEERPRTPRAGEGTSEPVESRSSPEGGIGRIAGLSEKGKHFVEKAREAASFKRNLLLIGPPGTLFEQIGRDIVASSGGTERCLTLQPGDAGTDDLENLFLVKDEA
ncbi:MAG: response regulator, partial [Oceanipulchritudo sp.]